MGNAPRRLGGWGGWHELTPNDAELISFVTSNVVGLTDRLSGHVRRPRETPGRHRVQRLADDVPIFGHQTLKVFG